MQQKRTSERERAQRIREELVSPPPKGGKGKKGSSVLGMFLKKRSKKGKREDEVDEFLGPTEKSSLEGRDSQDSTERQQASSEHRKMEVRREQAKPTTRPESQTEPKPEPVRQVPHQLQAGEPTIRKVEPESPIANRFADRKLSIDTSDDVVKPTDGGKKFGESIKEELRSASDTSFENTPIEKSASPSSPNSNTLRDQSSGAKVDTKRGLFRHASPGEKITSPSESSVTSFDRPFSGSPDAYTPVDDLPPPLMADNDSEEHSSPIESTQETFDTTVDAPPSRAVTWSDSSLKTFFDDSNDVRDFLVLVQDRSGINIRNDHPDIVPLFQDANAKLQDLTNVSLTLAIYNFARLLTIVSSVWMDYSVTTFNVGAVNRPGHNFSIGVSGVLRYLAHLRQ